MCFKNNCTRNPQFIYFNQSRIHLACPIHSAKHKQNKQEVQQSIESFRNKIIKHLNTNILNPYKNFIQNYSTIIDQLITKIKQIQNHQIQNYKKQIIANENLFPPQATVPERNQFLKVFLQQYSVLNAPVLLKIFKYSVNNKTEFKQQQKQQQKVDILEKAQKNLDYLIQGVNHHIQFFDFKHNKNKIYRGQFVQKWNEHTDQQLQIISNIKESSKKTKQKTEYENIFQQLIKGQKNKLKLKNNTMDIQSALAFSKCQLNNLANINLQNNNLGDQGIIFICQAQCLNLRQISLRQNHIEMQGLKAISRANWPFLQFVDLSKNNINQLGIQYISKAQWPQLQTIILSKDHLPDENQIKDKGAQILVRGKWELLKCLKIRKNRLSFKGCEYLVNCVLWKRIQKIDLRENDINNKQYKELRRNCINKIRF